MAEELKEIISIKTVIILFNESGHEVLDVVGMFPGLGEVADGINAVWYFVEDDMFNAGMSGISIIPFVGWGSSFAKLFKKIPKITKFGRIIKNGNKLEDITYDVEKVQSLFTRLKELEYSDEAYRVLSNEWDKTPSLFDEMLKTPHIADAWKIVDEAGESLLHIKQDINILKTLAGDMANNPTLASKLANDPKFVEAWDVLSSSKANRTKISDLETVKQYREKASFDVSGMKNNFEASLAKSDFIIDLSKALNKSTTDINMNLIMTAKVPGTNASIPLQLSEFCYDKAIIYAEELTKQGFNVKKAFAFSKIGEKNNLQFIDNYLDWRNLIDLNPNYLQKSLKSAWSYHVVPIVECWDAQKGKIVRVIIDPFADNIKHITINDWMQSMGNSNFTVYNSTSMVNKYFDIITRKVKYNPEASTGVFIVNKNYHDASSLLKELPQNPPKVSSRFKKYARNIEIYDFANKIRDEVPNKDMSKILSIILEYKKSKPNEFIELFNDNFDILIKQWFSEQYGYSSLQLKQIQTALEIN